MNNKILVELYIPVLDQAYDVFLPINKPIALITQLLLNALTDLTENSFLSDKTIFLYDKVTGRVLDGTTTVKSSGLLNGSKIILF